jgi:hypothetical protein
MGDKIDNLGALDLRVLELCIQSCGKGDFYFCNKSKCMNYEDMLQLLAKRGIKGGIVDLD